VTPNAIVMHRRIRFVTSKVPITITSFLLFGAVWFARIDPSENIALLFLDLYLLAFHSVKFRVKHHPRLLAWCAFVIFYTHVNS